MFQIMILSQTGETLSPYPLGDTPMSFDDGAAAAAKVAEIKEHGTPYKYRIIKEDSPAPDANGLDWRGRERLRLELGFYTAVPWAGEYWYLHSEHSRLHFPHISKDNPGKIAFTESEEKGADDKQQRIRAGKYLTRFFGHAINESEIRQWASRVSLDSGDYGVQIATTPDDIIDVYKRGPHSCMANADYVRVYGAGDLGIAYLESEDGDISCRAICWPEKEIYGRVYGDGDGGEYQNRFIEKLSDMGFNPDDYNDSFNGARLLRIEGNGGFVCPYLDISDTVYDDGEYLRVGGGDLDAQSESGVAGPGHCCSNCGESYDPENGGGYLEDLGDLCESCANELTRYCEDCGETRAADDVNHLEHIGHYGRDVCESCAESYPTCDSCSEKHESDSTYHTADGETVCESCLDDYFTCENCGDLFRHDQAHGEESDYCESCGDEKQESESESESRWTRGTSPTVYDPRQRNLV